MPPTVPGWRSESLAAPEKREAWVTVSVFGGVPPQENGKVHDKYTTLEPLAVESAASTASITAAVPLVALGPERWTKSSVKTRGG